MRDLERPPSAASSASSDKYHARMPGPTGAMIERPRAQRLNDIEHHTSRGLGCGRGEDFGTPVSSGSNMGSVARFPKLDECAHFHYEHVELGALEVSVAEVPNETNYGVRVTSGCACWTLQRSYENFVMFDKQLHRCIFDRKFSSLARLPEIEPSNAGELLASYLERFSQLDHQGLNCGPVLNWLQLDNRGRRILVPESDSCPINTPAVAAAYAVRPYTAQAQDEISFQVGDMISVIDMPPPGESTWWRGKHGFAVGFFPAECVAVIGDKVPRHLTVATTVRSRLPVKPVLRKHGKLIAFFRSFILNRPSRRRLKQSGILKERVFGCDLGEHLLNSGQDVPAVLTCCAEFIENHGLVDGIYRLSGVTSNIQRLRHAFDEDRVPALHSDEGILQDIHSVASLLKMYFRELPNPLCTYQLYSTFVGAVQATGDAERLRRMRDAVRKLPPPHYRTLEYLMRHLVRVAARGSETGMTPRNVAIVWAPNLLRCKELEVGGVAALQGVGVQAVVTEFLVCYAELIFGEISGAGQTGRPKSLAITGGNATNSRLLSLEEARNRNLRHESDYIEVGDGPGALPARYHTIIELPPRKRNAPKRSPSLNWRAIFGRGGFGARTKSARQSATATADPMAPSLPGTLTSLRRLRPVKSADSLDGEDALGPLTAISAPPARPCGHSRSISHDSYFDHLADNSGAINVPQRASSPLDLSEIQLNFDLEEREMQMFSEEESTGVTSVEASPRRQRNDEDTVSAVVHAGGTKRKRSRLEERLQCDVELRFIDSQSPDQVMVTADIHGMETPSPLPTPGYLPLLSEASTPGTLHSTPISLSPCPPSNSPRISFRSFTLPLELEEETSVENPDSKYGKTEKRISLDQPQPSQRSSVCLSDDSSPKINNNLMNKQNNGSSERRETGKKESGAGAAARAEESEKIEEKRFSGASKSPENSLKTILDHEMTIITMENPPDEEIEEIGARSVTYRRSKKRGDSNSSNKNRNFCSQELRIDVEIGRENDFSTISDISRVDSREIIVFPCQTDLDSPMSCCEQQDLLDSRFSICGISETIFPPENSEKSRKIGEENDPQEWIMMEKPLESKKEKTIEEASAIDCSRLESVESEASRTSLDAEKSSKNQDTEKKLFLCPVEITDTLLPIEEENSENRLNPFEAIFPSGTPQKRTIDPSEDLGVKKEPQDEDHEDNRDLELKLTEKTALNRGNDRLNGNEENRQKDENLQTQMEKHFSTVSYASRLDNEPLYVANHNEGHEKSLENRNSKASDCFSASGMEKKSENSNFRAQSPRKIAPPMQHHFSHHFSHHHHHPHHHHHHHQTARKNVKENVKRNNRQNSQIQRENSDEEDYQDENEETEDPLKVMIPLENAAEPCEIVHQPEGASETNSRDSSPQDDSLILRDTAAILQELALQRLTGSGVGGPSGSPGGPESRENSAGTSKTQNSVKILSQSLKDEKSPNSHKQGREYSARTSGNPEASGEYSEMEKIQNSGQFKFSRQKIEDSPYLPPCLRARQARSTRASLSRSLDEGKFNRMTAAGSAEASRVSRPIGDEHSSTPNVGAEANRLAGFSIVSSEKSRNFVVGLDLGDPRCRERIEKYKEERRMFLRDKYRSESFRASPAGQRNLGNEEKHNQDLPEQDPASGEQALLARLKQRTSRTTALR